MCAYPSWRYAGRCTLIPSVGGCGCGGTGVFSTPLPPRSFSPCLFSRLFSPLIITCIVGVPGRIDRLTQVCIHSQRTWGLECEVPPEVPTQPKWLRSCFQRFPKTPRGYLCHGYRARLMGTPPDACSCTTHPHSIQNAPSCRNKPRPHFAWPFPFSPSHSTFSISGLSIVFDPTRPQLNRLGVNGTSWPGGCFPSKYSVLRTPERHQRRRTA